MEIFNRHTHPPLRAAAVCSLFRGAEEQLVALQDSAEERAGEDNLPRLLHDDNPCPIVCLDGFEPSITINISISP